MPRFVTLLSYLLAATALQATAINVPSAQPTSQAGTNASVHRDSSAPEGLTAPSADGACCFGDGSCMDTDQNDCENVQGGVWHGGTDCASYDCSALPSGACCFADGSCMDTDQNDCENIQGGTWHGGTNCASYQCPTLSSGACCFADGSCMDTYQATCESAGGAGWHADIPCAQYDCFGSCCLLRVGDANGLGGDEPTIGDASVMIDAKFITGTCEGILECLTEADINQTGGTDPTCDDITIGDISVLIDYLFITGPTLGLAECL